MVLPFTLNYFVGAGMSAKGATREILIVAVVQLVLTAGMTYFAAPYGLMAVAGAYVLRTYLTLPYQQHVLNRYAGIQPIKSLRVIAAPLGASLCMVVALAVMRRPLIVWLGSGVGFVIAGVALGAIFYVTVLLLFGRETVASHLTALEPVMAPLKRFYHKVCSALGLAGKA
jgi:hypothetical protein